MWCRHFVKWYRFEHHHSGIKFLTSAERHAGKSEEILSKRHEVYEAAKAAHPERWNGRETRNWDNIEEVYLNPDKKVTEYGESYIYDYRNTCYNLFYSIVTL